MGKYDEALKAYDKAIELNPNSNPLWMGKGEIQKLLGHNTESQAAFTKAKELGYAGVIPTPGVVSLERQNSDAAIVAVLIDESGQQSDGLTKAMEGIQEIQQGKEAWRFQTRR